MKRDWLREQRDASVAYLTGKVNEPPEPLTTQRTLLLIDLAIIVENKLNDPTSCVNWPQAKALIKQIRKAKR